MTVGSTEVEVAANVKPEDLRTSHNDSGHHSPTSDQCVNGDEKATGILSSLPQEAIFKLTIQPISGESFDIQVNSAEMIQELHQVLLEREATCHQTCFSVQLNGTRLDHFTEIRAVPDLVDGSTLNVVEEPYTVREARIHIRHIRDLVHAPDVSEAASALDNQSLTFLPTINMQDRREKDKQFDGQPPEYLLPGTKERPLSYLLPSLEKSVPALRNLSISSFNPPPGPRKMKGDVLYVVADTVEKRRFHITCCTKGFFVNNSTDDSFNPSANSQNKNVYHSLVDLLSNVSNGFKKAYPVLGKRRAERHLLERLPTPYSVYSWLAPSVQPHEDSLRAEDSTQAHRVGYEEHLPGQTRDWNEELQIIHELPRSGLAERIIRDRSIFKLYGDFVGAAGKGALSVIDGNILAINPADEPKTHMFIWNNIFFSLGFDVKDHYKDLGGDAAAFAATSVDLQGLKAYAGLDDAQLHTLGMAIYDYRGYRVTAQSIIPGILDREQEQSVVYGSVDFGKTVVSSEKYHDVLGRAAKELKILPHEVLGEDGKPIKLFSSFESKGIIGNDGRQYVLDLLRTMPPDVHFLAEDARVTEKARELGYPRVFPHKLSVLRQELVEIFLEARCLQFIKLAAQNIRSEMKEKLAKNGEESKPLGNEEEVEMTRILVDVSEGREPNTTNPVMLDSLAKAAEAVGSLKSNTFDMRFNPDCFASTVKHADTEDLEKQQQLVMEAAEFMVTQQIPGFVKSCLDCSLTPIDGVGLSELIHARGINVRYLGDISKQIGDTQSFVRPLIYGELIVRSVKHVFRKIFCNLPQEQLGAAVSHMLNCLFGSIQDSASLVNGQSATAAKKSSKKGKKAASSAEWASWSTKSVWKAVCDEAAYYYGYDQLQVESLDQVCQRYGVQKVSLLRRVCRVLGIQLLQKDYVMDSAKKQPFTEDDVQNMFPVIKHRQPGANDAKKLYTRGQQAMQMGNLRETYECMVEAVNLMNSVYGAMHPELSQATRMLARLSYILGDPQEAVMLQHKATLISERCNGLDHGYTIVEYINLAHFAFANVYISAALTMLYRARYLLLIAHGEKHPLMAQIDGNIGVILYAVQEFDSAIKFLKSAESIRAANGETRRLKSALIQNITARCHAYRGDFRAALAAEKDTYGIYTAMFGPDHEKTKAGVKDFCCQESSEYLKQLTQQAVQFQKKMMDMNKGSSIGQLLPMQLQQPSLPSTLDVLNILNDIIIISVGNSADEAEETQTTNTKEVAMSEEQLD